MVTRQEYFFRDVVALVDVATLVASFFLSYALRDAPLGPSLPIPRLLELLAAQPVWKVEVVGFLRMEPESGEHRNGRRVLGSIAEAERLLGDYVIDEVIATGPSPGESELRKLASICLTRGVTFRT